MLERETPRVIFYSEKQKKLIEHFRQDGSNREYICILGEPDRQDRYTYEDIMAYEAKGTAIYEPPCFDDINMLIHTGGTTGGPKAAMMNYWAIFFNVISQILTASLNRDDCANVLLPFFHTAGWNVLMLLVLIVGGRVILTTNFCPEKVLEIIEKERPTICIGIEAMYKAIARHPNFEKTDFSSYRWMLNGAAPISRGTMEIYLKKGVRVVNAYGMTEAGPNNLCPGVNDMTTEEIYAKWSSVGRPMFFNNVRIVDERGVDVPEGESGELLFNGNLIFSGYWMDDEKTRSTVIDGWLNTGDIAYKDNDGYYYICGRKKNMFVSGGENIYPIEIEHLLMNHPAVESACVFGVADEKWGEIGKALIVLKPGYSATKEELQAYVGENSSSIKVPKFIQFLKELPKTPVGKVDMKVVAKKYGNCADE